MTLRARLAAVVAASLPAWTGACDGADAQEERGIHFTDATAESGLDFTVTSGSVPPSYLLDTLGTGIALVDYDRDGDPDVFVANGATVESPDRGPGCRLYENLGGLLFRDVTGEAGLTFDGWGFGVAQGDVDADGWPDLFVACWGENVLLRNTGEGGFEDVTARSGIRGEAWSAAGAFGDVDQDGDLDLYVVNYCRQDLTRPSPQRKFINATVFAGPMGLGTVPDVLYENDGTGRFTDVSRASGVRAPEASWGLSAVILDFDGDHQQDIYVGNDSTASFYFRGLGGGRFEEVGVHSGVALSGQGAGQATMGIALGDVDGNGLPDLFTTNFMYDTNTLHLNLPGGLFADRTMAWGLHLDGRPFLSWATAFHDFDHDADEDLVYFNGHIYPRATCERYGWNHDQVPVLLAREQQRFRRLDAATAGDWLAEPHGDRSAAFGDLDGDGDVDMVVGENNGPVRVLRNDRDGGPWLIVRLRDERRGRDPGGTGSRIALHAGDRVQRRWIASGTGYLSASEPMAHFAFPAGAEEGVVEVVWPDGHRQEVPGVAPRRELLIRRR